MQVGFLKVLQKAGLVEVDAEAEDPQQASAERRPGMVAEPIAAPPPPALTPEILPATACGIEEQRSFDAFYEEQAVPASPFPAEKLLKLLDGLRAMDPAVRKAAIQAMDAADDAWTVDDAVLDAQRKIGALQQVQAHLAQQTLSAQAHAQEELKQREEQHQAAIEAVKRQIAELEGLRERELERAGADRAAIQAKAKAVEEASLRETARLEAELTRLRQIIETFAISTATHQTAAR
jgi:hypothetical protein